MRNRIKPRRWNSELLEIYKCAAEGCSNNNLQFKTTQLLFEVHDVKEAARGPPALTAVKKRYHPGINCNRQV